MVSADVAVAVVIKRLLSLNVGASLEVMSLSTGLVLCSGKCQERYRPPREANFASRHRNAFEKGQCVAGAESERRAVQLHRLYLQVARGLPQGVSLPGKRDREFLPRNRIGHDREQRDPSGFGSEAM